ncbi:Gfo/Idh/MocA family protein [Paenibacillus radicis (ex Xue et al. 2023)]|uniref:Gfo/Idh/MocA family oxidoreductase n=1 Tax=Paenibacillus radicis (ex Xue et al. 2023) TaxID=2972489 RepID=A0ABT1YIH4_9BACL|nr:Gfo/Idh/MocA family oxidoreductase [Paenibacillus radicis (ex Xue et al. 2023)]MCR8632981.1 Gfo/Idh/MocA family oxidoreductase [Paenibacillus radicis (ex Xue et al. 2023)]
MAKLKVGMIGFAHTHAEGFLRALANHPEVEIAGVADENRSYVEPFDKLYPYFENYKELLATDIGAVFICSENVRHARLTIDAAKAKKHIFCEKPLGTTVAEMEDMVAACKKNGVQLMTAFNNRYVQAVIRAKNAVESGEIGTVIAVKGTNKGALPRREWFVDRNLSGGGAMLDHSVHVMDLFNWILQSRVVEVYAESDTLFHDIPIDDTGMIHFKYENGVIGVLDTSWSRGKAFPMKRDLTLEIIGTKGTIYVDVRKLSNEVYSNLSGNAEWSDWGDNLNSLIVGDFVRSIRSGIPVPITGEDGLRSAVISFAAYESSRLGRPVFLSNP